MTNSEPVISPVKDEHFRAFGAIVHMFARHEFLMIGIVSKITRIHVFHAAMLMAELPYRGKRDTVLALIKMHLSPAQIERIGGYLGQLHQWNQLRNAIAHSSWTEGERPDSIKPFAMSVRGGDVNPIGIDHEERDYTEKELISIAAQLMRLHLNFRKYLDSQGLAGFPDPEAATDESRSSTSASGGSPSAK